MFDRFSYVPHRRLLYSLIWVIAVIELGLTASRIHYTRSNFNTHDPIVAELLITSFLTLLWVPLTFFFHRRVPGADTSRDRFGGLHHESLGTLLLWLMWLVGAAIATHHWPNRSAVGSGIHADILLAIVAFSWVVFALLTIVGMLAWMEYSVISALAMGSGARQASGGATRREKSLSNSSADTNGNTVGIPNVGYHSPISNTAPVIATV
ncbi:hypothetical protein FB45DRAFT_1054311 [Roridomyces roridus]|uniref:MARVEL domain-containing protein n=1 Tax=Roridomyces roridus TaxID=1738132 RepID=A0AAD7FVY0_9AGAR|nr:hypothetical protein FB45DRAFT_1054311 [Roridomyces roridus]